MGGLPGPEEGLRHCRPFHLIKKILKYGVSDESIEWFKSYLGHRHQKTKVNSRYSDFSEIQCGVPQGSTSFHCIY